MNRIGAIIADIHIGVIDDDIMIRELDEIFFNKINEYKLDFVIIAGDLFDKQIKVNGKGFKSLSVFIVKLVEYCCNNNTKLRIIQGTYSHDLDQLKYVDALLSVYFNNHNLDYKLIYSVTSEELFDNLKILYIPEEYIEDKKEYYKHNYSFIYAFTEVAKTIYGIFIYGILEKLGLDKDFENYFEKEIKEGKVLIQKEIYSFGS